MSLSDSPRGMRDHGGEVPSRPHWADPSLPGHARGRASVLTDPPAPSQGGAALPERGPHPTIGASNWKRKEPGLPGRGLPSETSADRQTDSSEFKRASRKSPSRTLSDQKDPTVVTQLEGDGRGRGREEAVPQSRSPRGGGTIGGDQPQGERSPQQGRTARGGGTSPRWGDQP